jgi:Ca2+-binding EF-hand superfamily protein
VSPPPPPEPEPPTPHESAGPPLQAHGSVADATVDEFRKAVLERGGAHGIHTLACIFKHFDEDGSKTLNAAEMEYGLNHYGLHLDKKEIHMLMLALDQKGDPSWVSFDEFLAGVRGSLNERRNKMVGMAFGVLDKDRSGFVDLKDMKMMYDTKHHPEVKEGKMSEDEALEHLLEQFEQGARDGKVTKEEFQHYYSNISASVDEDDYFELMVRNAWHIPGGEGWCANTSNARVLVTFRDGSQKVVMIEQDLGLDLKNKDAIKASLKAQGVRHIANVDVKGAA